MRALAALRTLRQSALRRGGIAEALLEGVDRDLRGHLPGLRAAHPVGDDEQRRARQQRVLVRAPLTTGVGGGVLLGDAQHQSTPRSEFAVADPDAIARMQGAGRLEQLLVEVGAVGRARDPRPPGCCPAVRRARGARRQTDPPGGSPRDRRGRARRHHRGRRSSRDRVPARAPPPAAGHARRGRRRPPARPSTGRSRRHRAGGAPPAWTRTEAAPQVAQRAARDPQQEQIEHGQKAELEGNRYGRKRSHRDVEHDLRRAQLDAIPRVAADGLRGRS